MHLGKNEKENQVNTKKQDDITFLLDVLLIMAKAMALWLGPALI